MNSVNNNTVNKQNRNKIGFKGFVVQKGTVSEVKKCLRQMLEVEKPDRFSYFKNPDNVFKIQKYKGGVHVSGSENYFGETGRSLNNPILTTLSDILNEGAKNAFEILGARACEVAGMKGVKLTGKTKGANKIEAAGAAYQLNVSEEQYHQPAEYLNGKTRREAFDSFRSRTPKAQREQILKENALKKIEHAYS